MQDRTESRKILERIPDWLWASLGASLLLLISAVLGLWAKQPWLFPSLGPAALLHAYQPSNRASRFYNTVVGNFLGIGAGYVSVLIFHANSVPAVLSTEELTGPRIAASILATFRTVSSQVLLKAFSPPAAATTLLITLGAFKYGTKELQIHVAGVLIIASFGEGLRRLRNPRTSEATPTEPRSDLPSL